jgi:hypothetical protein
MADTGLLCSGYGISPAVFQSESPAWQSINGALTENYIATSLIANGFTLSLRIILSRSHFTPHFVLLPDIYDNWS